MDADLLLFLALTAAMGLSAWLIGWLLQEILWSIPLILAGLALFGLAGFFAYHWAATLAVESNSPDPDGKTGVARQINALLTIALLAGPCAGLLLGARASRLPGTSRRTALLWAVLATLALTFVFRLG